MLALVVSTTALKQVRAWYGFFVVETSCLEWTVRCGGLKCKVGKCVASDHAWA